MKRLYFSILRNHPFKLHLGIGFVCFWLFFLTSNYFTIDIFFIVSSLLLIPTIKNLDNCWYISDFSYKEVFYFYTIVFLVSSIFYGSIIHPYFINYIILSLIGSLLLNRTIR